MANNTPSASFKTLLVIHKAFIVIQIVFAGIAFYLSYSDNLEPSIPQYDKLFQIIAIIFSATGLIAGNTIFKRKTEGINNKNADIQTKFNQYRSGLIIQWALLEAPTLFSIISFILIGNYAFLALAGFLIFYFGMLAPSKPKIAIQLKVRESDLEKL